MYASSPLLSPSLFCYSPTSRTHYYPPRHTAVLKTTENVGVGNVGGIGVEAPSAFTIKGVLGLLKSSVGDGNGERRVISLGIGDPTAYSCFGTTAAAEESVIDALLSHEFNGYAPTVGLPQTREAIADYLSANLPYKLSVDDVYVTAGCTQAIEAALSILARTSANVLVPRPGFPLYELCASLRKLEIRNYDLLPERGWEVDIDGVESIIDHNTIAMVVINPGNPCGNVYSYHHLQKIAQMAKRHGMILIADEVYGHLAFGSKPFVPMGVFGSMVPVLTLGSLSKRWLVPGWRLGWLVTCDPNGIFKSPKVIERMKQYFDICGGATATFVQASVPHILEQTNDAFYKRTLVMLRNGSDACWDKIKEIPSLTCPYKPEGSMAVMVKLNLSLLKGIRDDVDFCFKLAKEESLIILPGVTVGLKHWVRITFAAEQSCLEEGLERIKSFCHRHSVHHQELLISRVEV